jgi:hypothetical protein
MGALCSGKSDNPQGLDSGRPSVKNQALASAPKNTYALEKTQTANPNATTDMGLEKPASGLIIDDKAAKNI